MSDNVSLGLRAKDFSKQKETVGSYTNVQISTGNNTSVRAKSTGSSAVVPPLTSWGRVYLPPSSNVIATDSYIRLSANNSAPACGVYSDPANLQYYDVEGLNVHVSADIALEQSLSNTSAVTLKVYTRKTRAFKNAADALYSKEIGIYRNTTNHVDYTFKVGGNWFGSVYKSGYLAFAFELKTTSRATATITNVSVTTSEDTGSTLTAYCPWGTPAIARQILGKLSNFEYRPFEATGARLDPAAELGDNAEFTGEEYGYGIYSQEARFGSDFVSSLSAPYEEELDHEYPYTPSSERRFTREIKTLKAELSITDGKIDAKVSSTGGSKSSFGWTLKNDNFTVYANNKDVLKITKSGASITGRVVATSGTIGDCEIVNGKLQVASANIGSISANQITAGKLSVERIEDLSIGSSKLAQGSVTETKIDQAAVTEPKLANLAVSGGKIAGGAVSYGKTDSFMQGQVNQIGTNMANIEAINKKFVTALSVVGLEVTGGGIIVKYQGANKTFVPRAKNDSAMSLVLGAT